jgi:peptidoglycan/LPS O-acetylase OafA/YrhL
MKKSLLIIAIAFLLLLSAGLWLINVQLNVGFIEILQFAVVLVLTIFALIFGLRRFASAKKGEPVEDELSRNIMRRTASTSYYISIYLWLFLMYYSDKTKLESHTLIGAGILGMAIVFFICWVAYKITGIKNG